MPPTLTVNFIQYADPKMACLSLIRQAIFGSAYSTKNREVTFKYNWGMRKKLDKADTKNEGIHLLNPCFVKGSYLKHMDNSGGGELAK